MYIPHLNHYTISATVLVFIDEWTGEPVIKLPSGDLFDPLKTDIQRGRSTDGPIATNDINRIDLWKLQQANATEKKSQTKPPRNRNKN